MAQRVARHWKTDSNDSLCEATGTDDVFTYGSDTGPNDYCSACYAADPEWTHATDEEFQDLLNHIF